MENKIVNLNNKNLSNEEEILKVVCKNKLGSQNKNKNLLKNIVMKGTKKYGILNSEGKVKAFVVVNEDRQYNMVYISWICSNTKGGGSELLKYIKNKYKKLGYTQILLQSRPHAIKFYEKQGYYIVIPRDKILQYFPFINSFDFFTPLMRKEI